MTERHEFPSRQCDDTEPHVRHGWDAPYSVDGHVMREKAICEGVDWPTANPTPEQKDDAGPRVFAVLEDERAQRVGVIYEDPKDPGIWKVYVPDAFDMEHALALVNAMNKEENSE